MHMKDKEDLMLNERDSSSIESQKLSTPHSPLPTEKAERFFFRASAEDFKKIPGSPIAYWVCDMFREAFSNGILLRDIADPKKGLATTDNNRFLRFWFEVSKRKIGTGFKNKVTAEKSGRKWFPLNKGGKFRKWYGNKEYVINWEKDGKELKEAVVTRYGGGSYTKEIRSEDKYFKDGITWSALTSSVSSFRLTDYGVLFDSAGSSMIPSNRQAGILGLLNTPIIRNTLTIINPTLNFGAGTVANIAVILPESKDVDANVGEITQLSKTDWDSYEIGWDFTTLPLLQSEYHQPTIETTFSSLRAHWLETTLEMQRLEEENNRIFIEAYGLQDELTPDVPLNEITLTCNPFYRYGKKVESVKQEVGSDGRKTFPLDPDLEERLRADTMKEFISYAVGCMFGRYSLDAPGLILANQGEGVADYVRKVRSGEKKVGSEISFEPDADNVIPILGDNWFTDDIVERFQCFLKVTFGEEHYEENLNFIEKAIGKSLRKYFLKDFYSDHVKRYKKRPIYWLFSSPKGSFNALIYMHRYRPDTVSVILNDYLREFRTKLTARKEHLEKVSISADAGNREKTAALKEIDKLSKTISELNEYETMLYDLATRNIEIDLDDGVKANYPKFGQALKKIAGLS